MIWKRSGHSLGGTGALLPLGGWPDHGGGCPLQEDFLLVSTVDREGVRSQSLEVGKQRLAQERAVELES